MAKRLEDYREAELTWIRWMLILSQVNDNVNWILPLLAMIATFFTYTYVMGQPLTGMCVLPSAPSLAESLDLSSFEGQH